MEWEWGRSVRRPDGERCFGSEQDSEVIPVVEDEDRLEEDEAEEGRPLKRLCSK